MVPGVMFKTVSEACNLACDYCYYSRTKGVHGAAQAIDMNLLETFMSDYMLHTRGSASLSWQGGGTAFGWFGILRACCAIRRAICA